MAKRKAAPKRKVSKAKTVKPKVVSNSSRKNVNITKASNGYIISSYDDKGEKTVIASTKADAKKQANKMLDI